MAKTYISIREGSSPQAGQGSTNFYSQSFSVANWTLQNDYYFLTIPFSSHLKTNNLIVNVFEQNNGVFEQVDIFVQVNGSFDVTLRINAAKDNRFAGKFVIL